MTDSLNVPSMYAATPAARAPGECSSVGIMSSVSSSSMANSSAEKKCGLEFVAGAAPTAPTAQTAAPIWISSRRVISLLFILDFSLAHLIGQAVAGSPGERHDRPRGVVA